MKEIRGLVEELLVSLDLNSIPPRRRALNRWKEIAGEQLASSCSAPVMRGDVLFLTTSSNGAAMEIRFRSCQLLRALNSEAGSNVFKSIKVKIAGKGGNRKDKFGRQT